MQGVAGCVSGRRQYTYTHSFFSLSYPYIYTQHTQQKRERISGSIFSAAGCSCFDTPQTPRNTQRLEEDLTKAIAALLEIMADAEAPLRRRIEAASGLLDYEAPAEAVEIAKAFLTAVFEDADQHVDFRLDALKLMRKAEARKITQPTTTAADAQANREAWRKLEVARRRAAMAGAGMWPPAKGWADDLSGEAYVAPPGSAMSNDNLADTVRQSRLRATSPAKGS